MSTKLTKIVATLGPATDSAETIKELIELGVNVFRFNTKHSTPQWHEERIKRVQDVADEMGQSIGILLDLQGPEIRIETKDKEDIFLKKDEVVRIGVSFAKKDTKLVIPHIAVIKVLKKEDLILIDDGDVVLEVVSKKRKHVLARAVNECQISNRKGVNIPGKKINLPSLVSADLRQLDMASMNKVDFIALSFARNKNDVIFLKTEMEKRKVNAQIVVKIENQQALDNLDELIEESDAVMIARGDLGVEVPIEELSFWQKKIIEKCIVAWKPVITATEMLDSMIIKSHPTRAEATDVSNAVFDGTDALMLSGETATGKYPKKAVKIMARIAKYSETVRKDGLNNRKDIGDKTQAISAAAMEMIVADGIHVDKVIVFTQTGRTARIVSSFRPKVPVVVVTESQQVVEWLTLSYGLSGCRITFPEGKLISPSHILKKLNKKGVIKKGETLLLIHGSHLKQPWLTNSITLVGN